MLKIKKFIKSIIRIFTETITLLSLYTFIIETIGISNEFSLFKLCLCMIYAAITVSIFEWAWRDK